MIFYKKLKNKLKNKIQKIVEKDTYIFKTQQEELKRVIAEQREKIIFLENNISIFCSELDNLKVRQKQIAVEVNRNYLSRYNTKKNKVVYTCLTGKYDILPLHEYLDPNYDYVCFTDNNNLLQMEYFGAWKILPLQYNKLNDTKNNRWHKLHPHFLFPAYEESIYLDSNITIKSNWLFERINQVALEKNLDMIIPIHFECDCIYEEAERCVAFGKESQENVRNVLSFIGKAGMPLHYGMNENNCIYRKHHNDEIIAIMEEWWNFIENYSKRDQLSLAYVLYKHRIRPIEISIENLRPLINDIEFSDHIEHVEFSKKTLLPNYKIVKSEYSYNLKRDEAQLFIYYLEGEFQSSDLIDVYAETKTCIYKAQKVCLTNEENYNGFRFVIPERIGYKINLFFVNETKKEIYGQYAEYKLDEQFKNLWNYEKISEYEKIPENEIPEKLGGWFKSSTKGKYLNLKNPQTFSEKLQWLKLYDRNPLKTILADKLKAPLYVTEKLGKSIRINKVLKIWDEARDVEFSQLPDKFVLKCNHGSGMNIIINDKKTADLEKIKQMLNRWMRINYAHQNQCFELHYSDIERKIFAEEYLETLDENGLLDFKIHCFNGKPVFIQVMANRGEQEVEQIFYDLNWKKLNFIREDKMNYKGEIPKPKVLEELIKVSQILAQPFVYVRLDFYIVDEEIYFGEFTFAPSCGIFNWDNPNTDLEIGKMLEIGRK